MFKDLWKKIDGFLDSIDPPLDKKPGPHQMNRSGHQIHSIDGHIRIYGEYKSLTINGRRIRLPEAKK